MSEKKGFLDTIAGLFGGSKNTASTTNTASSASTVSGGASSMGDILEMGKQLMGSEIGDQLLSKLGDLKTLDTSSIQSILGALGKSSDTQVQAAKKDLQTVQHDGESFVTKLQGYASQLTQIIPLILPTLQKLFVKS